MFSEEQIQKMYTYCLSLTKNEDEAHDLLQAAFLKFYAKKGQDKEFPKSYMYRIIKNRFIDDQRKLKNWRCDSVDDTESNANIMLMTPDGLNDTLISKEETEYILGLLKPEESELLYLWAVEGYTVSNLSEMTDTPKGTLLSRLHRIKKKLRKLLQNKRVNVV